MAFQLSFLLFVQLWGVTDYFLLKQSNFQVRASFRGGMNKYISVLPLRRSLKRLAVFRGHLQTFAALFGSNRPKGEQRIILLTDEKTALQRW